MVKALVRCLPN